MTEWIAGSILYKIFYSALIFLAGIGNHGNIGVAVIVLTLIVKTILAPLSYKALVHQMEQKKLQPKIKEIQKLYKDNKEEQSKQLLALYKEHKTNPLSGCLLVLLQLPVILALYAVFLKGLSINPDSLFPFIQAPERLNLMFLGIDLGAPSIIMAILAGVSQFVQLRLSPLYAKDKDEKKLAPGEVPGIADSMQKSMRFTMPIMIGIVAYFVPAAVALYWVVTNIFTIIQEVVIRKRLEKQQAVVVS